MTGKCGTEMRGKARGKDARAVNTPKSKIVLGNGAERSAAKLNRPSDEIALLTPSFEREEQWGKRRDDT